MNHQYYMQQALELARQGWPRVAPNPMVGCVIEENDRIVASGFHQTFGEAHAEVNAINLLPPQIQPAGCTLYVTLEPCSHHGKTPPCAELIINKGFKRVVVACSDPNPLVAGLGIKKMREAGIEVTTGLLEKEARELNKRFITFFEQKRPYYILKWAQTADGFVSRLKAKNKEENRISGAASQQVVHRLRAEAMGIMVGKNTVLNDNPLLTTRLVDGKNPVRIFIDRNLQVPMHFNIYNSEAPTLVFNALRDNNNGHIRHLKINFDGNVLQQVSEQLYNLNIQSVLVEGGPYLLADFIEQNLWDETLVFQNPDLYFKEGIKAPAFAIKNTFDLVGDDKLYHHAKNEALPAVGVLGKEIF